ISAINLEFIYYLFFIENLLFIVGRLLLIIFVLVRVAFLTLLERKVLGYIQIRKGPNKVGIVGIPQPFCDAIKLFTKEQTYPLLSNYISYYFSPIFSLFLSLLLFSFNLGLLFFLCCTSLGVYTVIIAGGLRAVAQTISYEVRLALVLLSFIFLIGAETNRTPFDFAEGESELVSGFNVEYRRGGFALIFLAEYASILFIRILFCVIFLGSDVFHFVGHYLDFDMIN
ncbi:NADH-ubiquinone oxidoreductase chain 1, partial [Lucilia cuprina]